VEGFARTDALYASARIPHDKDGMRLGELEGMLAKKALHGGHAAILLDGWALRRTARAQMSELQGGQKAACC